MNIFFVNWTIGVNERFILSFLLPYRIIFHIDVLRNELSFIGVTELKFKLTDYTRRGGRFWEDLKKKNERNFSVWIGSQPAFILGKAIVWISFPTNFLQEPTLLGNPTAPGRSSVHSWGPLWVQLQSNCLYSLVVLPRSSQRSLAGSTLPGPRLAVSVCSKQVWQEGRKG